MEYINTIDIDNLEFIALMIKIICHQKEVFLDLLSFHMLKFFHWYFDTLKMIEL